MRKSLEFIVGLLVTAAASSGCVYCHPAAKNLPDYLKIYPAQIYTPQSQPADYNADHKMQKQ